MIKDAFHALRAAERPVLIFGAGVRLAGAGALAREVARVTRVPVAVTWGARDLFPPEQSPVKIADAGGGSVLLAQPGYLCVGGFGTHGTRAANFAVQNADWILSVGSRLDSKATGTPREYFARGADIFMADIDAAEVRKFGGKLGRTFTGVQADAQLFLQGVLREISRDRPGWPDFAEWRARCADWLAAYPTCPARYEVEYRVNPYVLMRCLSERCAPGAVIVSDTGLSLAWLMQAFEFKEGQQFIHALNQTPMGYGLPAAIGAARARPGSPVVLVTGDGGLMLNIQELPLLAKHRLPIKIVLLNNAGHGMCRQTQDQWLGGKYYSTSSADLALPDFCKVARAFGVRASVLEWARDVGHELDRLLSGEAPQLLDAQIDDHRLVPQVPYGKPNEDGSPPLPRDELRAQMFVEMIE